MCWSGEPGIPGRTISTEEILAHRISGQSQSSQHNFLEERIQSILIRVMQDNRGGEVMRL